MPRNKYPELTVERILDAAEALFMERGYDATSLQDIIDTTGLSKGAIYHHFSSKEEIFESICRRIGAENGRVLGQVRDNPALNGKQKLREIFKAAILGTNQERMFQMVPYLLDMPKFLAMQLKSLFEDVVPNYIAPILEQGIADGSIQTEHPKELGEALMMLSNVWIHPLLQPATPEEIRCRCAIYNQMTQAFGIELLDSSLVEALVHYSLLVQSKKTGTP